MLFSLGHGQRIVVMPPDAPPVATEGAADGARAPSVPYARALAQEPPADGLAPESAAAAGGPFGYLFPDAAGPADDPDIAAKLSQLADAMVETGAEGDDDALNSSVPPVFTYFGQFIDHDVTANTDRDVASSQIDGPSLAPLPRPQVLGEVMNLRKGSLNLDSLYGDGPDRSAFALKLERAMRHPTLKAKMRLGLAADVGGRPPLPADPAVDVLRLGRLLDSGAVTQADLQALPAEAREGFFLPDGSVFRQKAVIGDGRNDENLIVAQLQVLFLRFHNKVVDWLEGRGDAPGDPDALFEEARKLVRWHYQWLVVNAYLPQVCDPAIVHDVKRREAPLYAAFHAANVGPDPELMPLPLEFSVSAFRFGHSMVRAEYDHNRFFGREADGTDHGNRAGFDLLFLFTGRTSGGHAPLAGEDTLPSNWIIEWERFVEGAPVFADRAARRIDTRLAPPLANMLNEAGGVFKHLAERNLRRGHRLNVPTAQACLDAMDGAYDRVERLSEDQLCQGRFGQALRDAGLVHETPLWAYVLQEADVLGNGKLGPLGGRIVADTLVGLCVKDPTSFWNASGSDAGRWCPDDGARPADEAINDFAGLARATGQLAGAGA